MPTCTNCGAQNPVNTSRCEKCGVALGHQARAKTDAQRSLVASVIKNTTRIATVVIVACLILPTYRFAGATYFRYRLNSVTEGANKVCGGPVTQSMQASEKDQVSKCLAADENLTKAQTDYSNFTHEEKH